jgi:hypothetical protein
LAIFATPASCQRTLYHAHIRHWGGWRGNFHRLSGRDFDLKNPNCCRVIREEAESIINRFINAQEISVELNNETSKRDVHGANLNDRIFFDVCGKQKGRIEYNWQAV